MTITAEGVETPGQAQRLRSSGCHELQGFLFSKAQPEGQVPALLDQHHMGTIEWAAQVTETAGHW